MRTLSPSLISSSFQFFEQLICSVQCCFNPLSLLLALMIHSSSVIGFLRKCVCFSSLIIMATGERSVAGWGNFPMFCFLVGHGGVQFSLFYAVAALVIPLGWMTDGVVKFFSFQYFCFA